MIKIIFLISLLLSSNLAAASCTDVAKYDEKDSVIYVVCPELHKFSNSKLGDIVYKVLTLNKFEPDEYIVNFVSSSKYLSDKTLNQDNHIGLYYTHNNELVVWPKNKHKIRHVQLRL